MTVKTGTAWAGSFVTLDATGALAAGTPSGVLYVDGVANGATVTITGSNPYKWSVTLPSLTAGQRVDMYITATISTIATAGFVASEQADTALVSEVKTETADILADTGTDGVKIASGELSTVATASSITALDGKIDTIDNFLDTEVAAILADTNELQAELADGGRTDLLIDAIKAKTDTITAAPTAASVADAVWDEAIADHTSVGSFGAKNQKVVPSETINDYKADVSGLATQTSVNAIPTSPLLAANYVAPDNATITTIAGNVDDLETRLTAARAGYLDNLNTGVALTEAGVDAILDEVVVGTYTMRQMLTVMGAAMAGKLSGGGTTTLTFRGVNDASNVIVATVDANGNRSALTLTV